MSNPDDRSPSHTPSPSLKAEASHISTGQHGSIVYQLEVQKPLQKTCGEVQLEADISPEPIMDSLQSDLLAATKPLSLQFRTDLVNLLMVMLPEREETLWPDQGSAQDQERSVKINKQTPSVTHVQESLGYDVSGLRLELKGLRIDLCRDIYEIRSSISRLLAQEIHKSIEKVRSKFPQSIQTALKSPSIFNRLTTDIIDE